MELYVPTYLPHLLLCKKLMMILCAGAVPARHCRATSASDRHVLRWCELSKGTGQSEEDWCYRSD